MNEFFDFEKRGAKSHYRRKPLLDGSYYHVFKRREDGANVYLDDSDRATYLDIIRRLIAPRYFRDERGRALRPLRGKVKLLAFCLLENHYHLILYVERGACLTEFMHRLQTAYGRRFNIRHGRRGSVFDERYDAELITSESQLKRAIAYVHANPGAEAMTYEWSGHRMYLDDEMATVARKWFARDDGLRVFGNHSNYLAWFSRAVARRRRRELSSR